jgi:hypothetical protein
VATSSIDDVERRVLGAAADSGWKQIRCWRSRTSRYCRFRHPTRHDVTVRISDHPHRARRGEKILSIQLPHAKQLWEVMKHFRSRGRPKFKRSFRAR